MDFEVTGHIVPGLYGPPHEDSDFSSEENKSRGGLWPEEGHDLTWVLTDSLRFTYWWY